MDTIERYEEVGHLLDKAYLLASAQNSAEDKLLCHLIDNARDEIEFKLSGKRKRKYQGDPPSPAND